MTTETLSLAQANEALREDHQRLHALTARLRDAPDLPALLSTLEEMNAALVAHFAHEENPGGFYDELGVCAPEHRASLGALVDEHYRILADLRLLAARTRELLASAHESLLADARRLADVLGDHERREHEMADAAMKRGR